MTRNKLVFKLIFGLLLLGMNCQIVLFELQSIQEGRFENKVINQPRVPIPKVKITQAYIEQEPIIITSNFQLNSSFPGKGTINDPIRIEGYNITSSDEKLISISGTSYYFRIENNLLKGQNPTGWSGIYLYDVIHCTIFNNTILNHYYAGIDLDWHSSNNIIANNTIYGSDIIGMGIYQAFGDNNIISNNTVYRCGTGIVSSYSDNTTISYNHIFENIGQGVGIDISEVNNSIISSNTIHNFEQGLGIGTTNHSLLINNVIHDCNNMGIDLQTSNYNRIAQNVISNCNGPGINLDASNYNTVLYNDLSENNQWVNFQAIDKGSNNVFVYNYWSDWTSPDANGDGVVDEPYVINGSANNQDKYPLVVSGSNQDLPSLLILCPIGGENLNGTTTIEWLDLIDSLDHSVNYTIYYSSDEGAIWTELANGLTSTSYEWNTTKIPDGLSYLIKIVAISSEGEIGEGISRGTFAIQNTTTSGTPGMTVLPFLFALVSLITLKRSKKK